MDLAEPEREGATEEAVDAHDNFQVEVPGGEVRGDLDGDGGGGGGGGGGA